MATDRILAPSERLSTTLFVAVLAHGIVILGITFSSEFSRDGAASPVLKVTLLVDDDDAQLARAEDAEWLAQRMAGGAGRAADGLRPTTALASNQQLTQIGDPSGADPSDGTPRDPRPSAEQLVTRSPSADRLQAVVEPADAPAPVPMRAAALFNHPVLQSRAAEIDLTTQLPDARQDDPNPSPATRASVLAEYLDSWRRRVERIGTANFPRLPARGSSVGRPTLEVAIGAGGELEEIIVRTSSGDGARDQAALHILRMAAPFEPLPPEIRADYAVLRFAYEWDFDGGRSPSTPVADSPAATISE
jgi:protein TonB